MENTAIDNNQDNNLAALEAAKNARIELRKKSFYRKVKLAMFIAVSFLLFLIFAFVARNYYVENKDRFVITEEYTGEGTEIVKVVDIPTDAESWQIYDNSDYKFNFRYLQNDKLEKSEDPSQAFRVTIKSKDIVPTEKPDGFNMIKGYIFEISPLAIALRDVSKVAEVKQTWFRELCPDSARIGNQYNTIVSGYDTTRFEVVNCNSDFIVSYIPANDVIYEIIQTFKGDVGFKQSYKLQTNLMIDSLKISEKVQNLATEIEYDSWYAGLKFSYPKELDTTCCNAPSIDLDRDNITSLITLSTGSNESTMGFYYLTSMSPADLNSKLEQFLIDDYQVIKGRKPDGKKTEFLVDGRTAYRYEGFSWKGNDIITFEARDGRKVVLISILNFPKDIEEKIIKSIKYY